MKRKHGSKYGARFMVGVVNERERGTTQHPKEWTGENVCSLFVGESASILPRLNSTVDQILKWGSIP